MSDYDLFSNWISYDPKTGDLTWKKRRGSSRAGRIITTKNRDGYILVGFNGAKYSGHRVAWLLHYGSWPEGDVDHIDLDKANNRIDNLRTCTDAQNQWNSLRQRGRSKLRGVDWHNKTKRWRARIRVGDGRRLELGYFKTEEEAHAAYAEASRIYHKNFSRP